LRCGAANVQTISGASLSPDIPNAPGGFALALGASNAAGPAPNRGTRWRRDARTFAAEKSGG